MRLPATHGGYGTRSGHAAGMGCHHSPKYRTSPCPCRVEGTAQDRQPLRLPRAYIQRGIRTNAERLATNQLGYRTVFDQEEAQRREVNEKRYTSLDRILSRTNGAEAAQADDFIFDITKHRSKSQGPY